MSGPRASTQEQPPADAVILGRDDAEIYAHWFQALSDPTRIVILSYLSRCGAPVPVGTIVEDLGIGQSTVSRHLRLLLDAGFVTRKASRTNRLYSVNRSCVTSFAAAAEVIMGQSRASQDITGTS